MVMGMEPRQLAAFLAVAEAHHFGRAAERLGVAQPAVSQAIRRLEADLGVELFVRTTRSVALTEAGRRLLADGTAALLAVEEAFANAAHAGHGVLGTLRLGCTPAARHGIRPAIVAALRERHPGIAVDASEATTGNLCRELLGHRLDAAVGFCSEPVPGLRRRVLLRERMWVLMRASHPLANASELSLGELRDCRFVLPGEGLNPGYNRRVRALCRKHGFEPRSVVASLIWEDAEWPAGSDLVALATDHVARQAPPHMRVTPLVPDILMPVELLWREDDPSPVLARFLDVVPRALA